MKLIPLTKGMSAMVDDEDFDFLNQWKWHVSLSRYGGAYAKRIDTSGGGRLKISMHRLLLKAPETMKVDHRDRNGLNNQKYNIRRCTQFQNCHNRGMHSKNTSGFKGVFPRLKKGDFVSRIGVRGKYQHIGVFKDIKDAARAYDEAAVRIAGDFAVTNKSLGLLG